MLSNWTSLCAAAFACVLVGEAVRRWFQKAQRPYPLPPGPPPLPIIGNIHAVDIGAPWLTYTKWAKSYGDLVHFRMFNQSVVVINSERVAKALMEDRSSNYADRPFLITNALFGIDFNTISMPYGDRWRLHRRFFHQSFKADSALRFIPMQQRRAHLLARRLLTSPDQVFEFIHEFTSSVIINAVYDYDPVSPDDHLVQIIGRSCKLLTQSVTTETAGILNAFPIILSIPSWFPGMSVKRNAALSRSWVGDWVELPFEHALKRQHEGSASPCMVFDGLRGEDKVDATSLETQALKDAAATGFVGMSASETSGAALSAFLFAMVLNPAIQDKAYVQIQEIVGNERLPTYPDRPSLPYIDAIMREVWRWKPVVPLAIPHAAVNDDVYEGYYIPKGTIIITNLWSMSHDESKYLEPDAFIPERFLRPDGTLTSDAAQQIGFGFGRRSCVGRHFAEMSVWYTIATLLALWKISFPRDDHGNEVRVEPKWAHGTTSYPHPFPCIFEPRAPGMDGTKLEELIRASG